MDERTTEVLRSVEAALMAPDAVLAEHRLDRPTAAALVESIKRRLGPGELERIEAGKRLLIEQPRSRPGSSALSIPIGIRG